MHRLGGEELVLQVHRHPLVPICGRNFVHAVPIVVGRVVDQHVAAAKPVDELADFSGVIGAVGNVAFEKERPDLRVGQTPDQRLAGVGEDIDECHRRTLTSEALDDAFADAARAATDDDALAGEAGIDRPVRHRFENPFGQVLNPPCRQF